MVCDAVCLGGASAKKINKLENKIIFYLFGRKSHCINNIHIIYNLQKRKNSSIF